MVSGTVLVLDTAPASPGVPGPAAAAVTSLVEGIGLTVAGTLAPSVAVDPSLASLAGSVIRDSIALLVVHPGNRMENEEDHSESLERPAALAQLFRRTGMRVLAVGVGASDIALAECVLQGAESAFAIGELPDELSQALLSDATLKIAPRRSARFSARPQHAAFGPPREGSCCSRRASAGSSTT